MEARRRFPQEPRSAGEARRFLRQVLDEWGLEDYVEAATLALSEVVTNAVLHAGSEAEVLVRATGPVLRVEVHDTSRQRPVRKRYRLDAGTGRGLAMVEVLADRWGSVTSETGKVVWFELATAEGVTRGSGAAATAAGRRHPRAVDGRGGSPRNPGPGRGRAAPAGAAGEWARAGSGGEVRPVA
ncbi:MAG: ATP-binding protein [Acidimicrobiales bacterium]